MRGKKCESGGDKNGILSKVSCNDPLTEVRVYLGALSSSTSQLSLISTASLTNLCTVNRSRPEKLLAYNHLLIYLSAVC